MKLKIKLFIDAEDVDRFYEALDNLLDDNATNNTEAGSKAWNYLVEKVKD